MKRPLEEAVELLRDLSRRNETRIEPELHRALSLIADSLHRPEQRLDRMETESVPRVASHRQLRLAPWNTIPTTA